MLTLHEKRMNNPILICMTPVKNEAWVLEAFLKVTSLWADYIIIADQNSTDSSRQIASKYPKVILIDNENTDFNEQERQKMLINRAREIKGDKILFGLDADEIFSADFMETNDWQKILRSIPGDVFWFKWAEVRPDKRTYWESDKTFFPWAFHDDGIEPHSNFVRNMHSMRIPYPKEENQMFYVKEFRVLHLAYLNSSRVDSKRRFYKFVDWSLNKRSVIKLSRSYILISNDPVYQLSDSMFDFKPKYGFDLFELVDTEIKKFWYDDYIVERMNNYPVKTISKLDIWEKDFLNKFQIKDNRSLFTKIVHWYLSKTKGYAKVLIIRIIDKFLSVFY